MPAIQTQALLAELLAITENNIKVVKDSLQPLPLTTLQRKPAPDKWSIVECLEHLNSYGRFYLPALQKAMEKGAKRDFPSSETYQSGWFGDYFANLMRVNPDGQPPSKMPAMKAYNPSNYTFDAEKVLNEFLAQQLFLNQFRLLVF
jgi:DinB superfamily